jgi:hypothetical protein
MQNLIDSWFAKVSGGGYSKSRAETVRICSVIDMPSKKMTFSKWDKLDK